MSTVAMAEDIKQQLAVANWILFNEKIVDGWGHVSARHPQDPKRFLLSRALAPNAVTADDILEYGLDGEPLDARGHRVYMERHIHSEIYAARPDVNAVVHSHSPALIAFSITQVPLQPVYHMAGFLHFGVPVFEMQDVAGDGSDMLVVGQALGKGLASSLGDCAMALIRGHGSVVVASHLEAAVARAIYAETNASTQIMARTLGGPIRALSKAEGIASNATYSSVGQQTNSYGRAYQIWKQQALLARERIKP